MLDLPQLNKHIKALNNGDENIRRETTRTLKQIEVAAWESASTEVIDTLVETLCQQLPKNREGSVKMLPVYRQEVVTILGNIGVRAEAAIPQLIEFLEEGVVHGLREAAITALGNIGKAAKPAVEKLLAILESERRATLAPRVARTLGCIGYSDEKVRAALVSLWLIPVQCQNSRVQAGIALCKLRLDAPGLLPNLTSTLVANPNVTLRKAAAEALAWRSKNDPDVVPAITAALHDLDEEVRQMAEAGLEQMRLTQAKAIQICAKQLKDSLHAETALKRCGLPSVPALTAALSAEEASTREKAAKTLGAIGEVAIEAAPALAKVLRDSHTEVRLAAAKALWNISKAADAVVPVLAALLTGKWPSNPEASEARRRFLQTVIEALSRIGPPAKAAIPALLAMSKDDNRLIRESALRTLKEIDPAAAAKAGAR
jgi:HEAT repeat protein